MVSSFKKFFVHFSQFLTGNVASQMLGFISFPILTRILTTEEYGIISLVTTTVMLTVAIAKAGLSDGIVRFYKKHSETMELLTIFASTIVTRGLLLACGTSLIYAVALPYLAHYLKLSDQHLTCFMLMAFYIFLRPMNIIVLNTLRVAGRVAFYNTINFAGKALSIALSLFFLLYLVRDFIGYFAGQILAEFMMSIILFSWFLKNHQISITKVSGSLSRQLMKFGLPILVSELAYLLLSYTDRYLITIYMGKDALGVYSVGQNLPSYIADMIMFSLSYAVIPIYVDIYEKEGKQKTEEFLQKCFNYLLILIIPLSIGYFIVAKELFIILASRKYMDAASFSPYVLLGSMFWGLNNIFNAGLYLKKKTGVILGIVGTSIIANILLNLFLIPMYGTLGGAMAKLITGVIAVALTISLSSKYIKVAINPAHILYHLALAGLMALVIAQISTSAIWIDLALKISVGTVIVASGVLWREKELLARLKSFFSKTLTPNSY